MALTLEYLLPSDQQLRTVQFHESVNQAINIMCQHRYGQLPVVDPQGDFQGQAITFESILLAVQSFRTAPETLLVRDAAQRVHGYPADADLLETLDDIHRDNFAIIVDESKLRGVMTTADAAAFFREYAEDLMLIEGIESRIRDAIQALYAGDANELEFAIVAVTDRTAEIRKRFPAAVKAYVAAAVGPTCEIDSTALSEAEKKLGLPTTVAKFASLGLSDLVQVLLRHRQAPKLQQSQDSSELRKLLHQVRDARNKLAHFRGELTPEERRTIKVAAKWLEDNLPAPLPEPPSVQPAHSVTLPLSIPGKEFEEEADGASGSYAPLADLLRPMAVSDQASSSFPMTFREIEAILKKDLPRSAHEYRAWWSNDPMKPQAAAWLNEGWRTTAVNMTESRLTFVRTNDRQEAYIRFFAGLNDRLGKTDFPLRGGSPQGINWQVLASLDERRPDSATIIASFSRQKRLRVELYLDRGETGENKQLFDQLLARRDEIERIVGEPMEWERMDSRRGCRIAVYTKAQILTDSDSSTLLEWSAQRATRLWRAFGPIFS
jgi:Domain of unknown function (DUF4268)